MRYYGVSCARFLARRRFSTRRPAFVAILARKPCVRARLRLLGWNVRFICLILHYLPAERPGQKKAGKGTRGTNMCQYIKVLAEQADTLPDAGSKVASAAACALRASLAKDLQKL